MKFYNIIELNKSTQFLNDSNTWYKDMVSNIYIYIYIYIYIWIIYNYNNNIVNMFTKYHYMISAVNNHSIFDYYNLTTVFQRKRRILP